jgi:hypothetical protein
MNHSTIFKEFLCNIDNKKCESQQPSSPTFAYREKIESLYPATLFSRIFFENENNSTDVKKKLLFISYNS